MIFFTCYYLKKDLYHKKWSQKMLNHSRKVIFSIFAIALLVMIPLAYAGSLDFITSFDGGPGGGVNFEIAEGMIRAFIKKVRAGFLSSRKVVMAVPSGVTEVEKRAVRDSAEHAGAKEVHLIAEPMSAAIGIGIDVDEAVGNMIIDIGGGSVEFIIGNQKSIQWMHSFEIGAQRLMDQFHTHDPISRREIKSLESFLGRQLVSLASAMEQYHPKTLVGSSGTFDTLSHIHCLKQGLKKSDNPEQPLSVAGFKEIHNELVVKDRAERLKLPGMIEMRVDMIVVACCLID